MPHDSFGRIGRLCVMLDCKPHSLALRMDYRVGDFTGAQLRCCDSRMAAASEMDWQRQSSRSCGRIHCGILRGLLDRIVTLAFCGEGMIFSRSQLPLFHVGMIGGLVGTVLLTASLAVVSGDFRSKDWKTLIIIGTAAGGALCLAGIGAKSFDHAGSLANPGDRVFIVVWQLLVSGYIGVLLFGAPSFSSGPSERGHIALWARRAVWALLLVSIVHAGIGFSRREKASTAASSATSGSSAA